MGGGGGHYVPLSLQHLHSGEKQLPLSMPPPLSWRPAAPCRAEEIKSNKGKAVCCLG